MRPSRLYLVLIMFFINYTIIYSQTHFKNNNTTLINPAGLMKQKEVKGIYLFNPNIEIDSFFRNCEKLGVNYIFTIEYFYKNREFLDKANQYGINIVLNFPVFFNQEYLEKNPEHYCIDSKGERVIRDWLHFACPSQPEFIEYQKNRLKDWLEFVNPKIVSFDFIRFFVFWEKVYPGTNFKDIVDGCYCKKCVSNFQKCTNLSLEEESAEWIKENVLQEWANWKCNLIEQVVNELVAVVKQHDENILIALKIVPWSEKDFNGAIRSIAGQDVNMLSEHVDIFIPMTYSHMLKREPSWINDITSEIHIKTKKQVLANIQIEKTYLKEDVLEDEFLDMMKYGNMLPSNGVILFHYDFILNPTKKCLKL